MLDTTVANTIAAMPVRTIDDVIAVMRRIDSLLPDSDGVKWFNFLYLRVTESVRNSQPVGWEDAPWLQRLDVVFATLYFDALVSWARDRDATSRAWRALFELRHRNVSRLQFAVAGMNAHINHDLAIAVVKVGEERNVEPERGTRQYRDFDRVNSLLERVEGEIKPILLMGLISEIDRHLGKVDDVLALWKVRKARETAWENAEILWELRRVPPLKEKFLRSLDRLVGIGSKGFLAPV